MKRIRQSEKRYRLAQAAIEYLIIASVILAAVLSSGIINSMRNGAFELFYQKAVAKMR